MTVVGGGRAETPDGAIVGGVGVVARALVCRSSDSGAVDALRVLFVISFPCSLSPSPFSSIPIDIVTHTLTLTIKIIQPPTPPSLPIHAILILQIPIVKVALHDTRRSPLPSCFSNAAILPSTTTNATITNDRTLRTQLAIRPLPQTARHAPHTPRSMLRSCMCRQSFCWAVFMVMVVVVIAIDITANVSVELQVRRSRRGAIDDAPTKSGAPANGAPTPARLERRRAPGACTAADACCVIPTACVVRCDVPPGCGGGACTRSSGGGAHC